VKVPFFAMVNLIAEKEIVPELVQQKFTVENIATEMNQIIPDGTERTRMIEGLAAVKAKLRRGNGDGVHPSEMAADIILREIVGEETGSIKTAR
jgi:lipid-A-disaccharide synthase